MLNVNDILKIAKGVSIDSRTIRSGELFIAIKGNRYDGHDFIADVFKKGACGAIVGLKYKLIPEVKRLSSKLNRHIVRTNDTVRVLCEIARLHRMKFDIPIVAVTGSNGKSTTKEMIADVLQAEWSPLKNPGTQNNLIGVPLTLLKLTGRYASAVIELGMNKPREIKTLTETARPNIGIITNIGPSHLEGLKNMQAVYRGKKELLDCLGAGDTAILNGDDAFLRNLKKRDLRILTFGIKAEADFHAEDIKKKRDGWEFKVNRRGYFLPVPAYHDIYNALAAVAVGTLFNIAYEEIKNALSSYTPLARRMVRSVFNGIEFIDDTYNSNPLSMESAVLTLRNFDTKGKKVLVSGDMLELGRRAVYYHNNIGRLVARSDIGGFIGVGSLMRKSFLTAKKGGMKNAWFCPSKEEAVVLLKEIAGPGDVILVKGSRAMQMEDVIECFITSSTR